MKLIVGLPHNPDFDPKNEGWQKLKEPGTKTAIAIGHLAGLLLGGLAYLIAVTWSDFSFEQSLWELDLWFLPLMATIIAFHERLHALAHPGWGISSCTHYGVIPKSLVFYAHYDASVTRNRFIAILVAPFIGLTVIPLLVATTWPPASQTAGFIAILNAVFSGLDLFNAALIHLRTPTGVVMRNQGWQSYWKFAHA